jgi:hypothetical protein
VVFDTKCHQGVRRRQETRRNEGETHLLLSAEGMGVSSRVASVSRRVSHNSMTTGVATARRLQTGTIGPIVHSQLLTPTLKRRSGAARADMASFSLRSACVLMASDLFGASQRQSPFRCIPKTPEGRHQLAGLLGPAGSHHQGGRKSAEILEVLTLQGDWI